MKYIPKISFNPDTQREAHIFAFFLNEPDQIQNRIEILETHKNLASLKNHKDTDSLKKYIDQYYTGNKKIVDKTFEDIKKRIGTDSENSLRILGELMEYEYPAKTVYKAAPTILSFSPFSEKEKSFNISIYEQINKRKGRDPLSIAIHEISHFIYYDYADVISKKHNIEITLPVEYYLKEALTAALLRQKRLFKSMRLGPDIKTIKGNHDTRPIQIEASGKIYNLSEYIEYRYKNKKGTFYKFLQDLIISFMKKEEEFSSKRSFWNKHGYKIFDTPKLLEKYSTPIRIS